MKPTLRIEGGRELERNLMALEGAVAKKLVMETLTDSLASVASQAKATVPRATGRLARSIGVGTRLTRRQRKLKQPIAPAEAYVGPGAVGKGGYRAVAHAHLVEFGTEKMAPRPYMRPAWESQIGKVFSDLGAGLWKRVRDAIKPVRERS